MNPLNLAKYNFKYPENLLSILEIKKREGFRVNT